MLWKFYCSSINICVLFLLGYDNFQDRYIYFIFRSVQIETILFPNDKLINFLQRGLNWETNFKEIWMSTLFWSSLAFPACNIYVSLYLLNRSRSFRLNMRTLLTLQTFDNYTIDAQNRVNFKNVAIITEVSCCSAHYFWDNRLEKYMSIHVSNMISF